MEQKNKRSIVTSVVLATLLLSMLVMLGNMLVNKFVPHRTVGTCIVPKDRVRESWQKPSANAYRIEEIGRKSYKMVYINPPFMVGQITDREFDTVEMLYVEVNCAEFEQ